MIKKESSSPSSRRYNHNNNISKDIDSRLDKEFASRLIICDDNNVVVKNNNDNNNTNSNKDSRLPETKLTFNDRINAYDNNKQLAFTINTTGNDILANNKLKSLDALTNAAKDDRHNQKLFTNLSDMTTKRLHSQEYNDYINDSDFTMIASMKPAPSTSMTKDLASRLNQLLLPVTRKIKFWNKKSFQVNQYDPNFKVIYLGNLGIQLWSRDEHCLEKPLATLWNNYLVNIKTEIIMRLTICNSGLKAITRQHGLTQYWSNRLVFCCSHKNHPKIFAWIYRHEGKKMRQELRCHAVLCPSQEKVSKMVKMLNERLSCALQEFRREKKLRNNTRVDATSGNPTTTPIITTTSMPLRRQILSKGSANFRPPLERSKSAPKLTSILEEDYYLE